MIYSALSPPVGEPRVRPTSSTAGTAPSSDMPSRAVFVTVRGSSMPLLGQISSPSSPRVWATRALSSGSRDATDRWTNAPVCLSLWFGWQHFTR